MSETSNFDVAKVGNIAWTATRWMVGMTIWAAQYSLIVWAVICLWAVQAVLSVIGRSFIYILLCCTIIGFVVLAYMVLAGKIKGREVDHDWGALWRPWALGWVKGPTPAA